MHNLIDLQIKINEFSTGYVAAWSMADNFRLAEAEMIVSEYANCNKAYGFNLNSNFHFCGRGKAETPAIECAEDVGSPFVQVDKSGRPILMGILSFGASCATNSIPGVYTKIKKYADWIVEAAAEMAPRPTTTTTTTTTTMAPAEQAGYSTSWPGFTLDEFNFECQSPFDVDEKYDHLPAASTAHMASIGSGCSASVIASRYLLTSMDCCANAVGATVTLQDGATHTVVNTRTHDAGICVVEVGTVIAYSTTVNPICIDRRPQLILNMPAFIPTNPRFFVNHFIALPISDQCLDTNSCFGFIDVDSRESL